MGQYWLPVNLDKHEYLMPHRLGTGLKLWEQLANHPGTGAALLVLLAAMPERRGGGDFQTDPMVGRWAGDRVVLVGDYSEDADLPSSPVPFSTVYGRCHSGEDTDYPPAEQFKDITDEVCKVIERELEGRFVGNGWRTFKPIGEAVADKLTQGGNGNEAMNMTGKAAGAGQMAFGNPQPLPKTKQPKVKAKT